MQLAPIVYGDQRWVHLARWVRGVGGSKVDAHAKFGCGGGRTSREMSSRSLAGELPPNREAHISLTSASPLVPLTERRDEMSRCTMHAFSPLPARGETRRFTSKRIHPPPDIRDEEHLLDPPRRVLRALGCRKHSHVQREGGGQSSSRDMRVENFCW